ncbi:hypothetical protein PR048_030480 [Dryococelus australis]|uniref:Uncharacterized protein n=1 Tax=Dryococelus australis TaxID=614101 RepID=A0ABQ9G935_9NEOP|nr:hypothetical protein PR048_030480 [Dryococelus australis]
MLGSFHTLMNLVGAIGTLMKGSVLQEIHAVLHMMSGKAISRAIRGHMLVDAALSTLLVADVFPCNEDGSCHKLIKDASTFSWKLHLEAIQECLVIVAAAGHHNYLKSGYKFLKDMLKLPSDNPSVYELFQKGHDRFWAGLGSDLMIEQVLMRSIKSRGGGERVDTWKWTYRNSAGNLVSFETSEQHKEVGESMRSRDISDFQKVMEYMKPISPFDCDTSFRSIITGVTADLSVNVLI